MTAHSHINSEILKYGLAFFAVLVLTGLDYAQGLGGRFLFDDLSNLNGLEALSAEPSFYNALQYALNGISSTLGRPLALATFALQHGSWDRHPADFIRFNILLHLMNGVLWYWLLVRLQRLRALPASPWLPLMACALWLLLPIHGSAVLYVVQRMALLAATFMLIGLLLYVSGRGSAQERPVQGYLLMSLGVAVGTVLGTLAKETAALLPLLILTLEATLLRAEPRPARWAAWSAVFLWLPALLLASYLALRFPAFLAEYGSRGFTLAERLLTESRVLFIYLGHAFLPSPAGIRLMYDDLALSTSLIQPWITFAAVVAWTVLITAAIRFRRQASVFSLAVAWYLIGHLLESSFIPLELAFDHRNYFPLMGPALALSAGLAKLASLPSTARIGPWVAVAGAGYLGILAVCLWLSASLWGRPLEQAHYWAQRQPESRRALYHYGDLLIQRRQWARALELYRGGEKRWPDDPAIALALLDLGCIHPALPPDIPDIQRRLQAYRGGDKMRALGLLEQLVNRYESGQCPLYEPEVILAVIDSALASPAFLSLQLNLYHASAMLLNASGAQAEALSRLDKALAIDPQIPLLQYAVLWSLQMDDLERARRYLQAAESDPRIAPRTRWIYREEIKGTRQLVELYESIPDA